MAQTTVEQLKDKVNILFDKSNHLINIYSLNLQLQELFEEAKQIEKNQIMEAYVDGYVSQSWVVNAERYYTQTYECKQIEDLTFKKKSQWTVVDKKQQ